MPEAGRHANVDVFAWHGGAGTTADQRDRATWEFYVVAERDLPEQKSIALKALQALTLVRDIDDLAMAVREASEHTSPEPLAA